MEKIIQTFKDNLLIVAILIVSVAGFFVFDQHQQHPQTETQQSLKISKPSDPSKSKQDTAKQSGKIQTSFFVDVDGAVNHPGVYRFSKGMMVLDAIKQAGGTLNNADLKSVNQAKKLVDSSKVYIPFQGEVKQAANINATSTDAENKSVVNINSAQLADFQNVKGVGPKKAQKIIDYREKNGDYQKIEDLQKVGGFGAKTIESLKDQLTV